MTNETYKKAEAIQSKLKDLNQLYHLAYRPWIRFIKERTWLSDRDRDEVCLCDEDLAKVIREYCKKRIKELEEELKSL